jgi:hypothetical protein
MSSFFIFYPVKYSATLRRFLITFFLFNGVNSSFFILHFSFFHHSSPPELGVVRIMCRAWDFGLGTCNLMLGFFSLLFPSVSGYDNFFCTFEPLLSDSFSFDHQPPPTNNFIHCENKTSLNNIFHSCGWNKKNFTRISRLGMDGFMCEIGTLDLQPGTWNFILPYTLIATSMLPVSMHKAIQEIRAL